MGLKAVRTWMPISKAGTLINIPDRKGFTLIELILVITLIGVVAALDPLAITDIAGFDHVHA